MNKKRPTAVTVIAVLQILVGLLWLGLDGYDLVVSKAAADPNDPGEVLGEKLEKHLEETAPGFPAFQKYTTGASISLSLLMIASGGALLAMLTWGRFAALLYVAGNFLLGLVRFVYALLYVIPTATAFLDGVIAKGGQDGEIAGFAKTFATISPYLDLLLLLYPLLVLVVMLHPRVAAAFRGEGSPGESAGAFDPRGLPGAGYGQDQPPDYRDDPGYRGAPDDRYGPDR